jgi:hypothetical protein
MKQIIVSNERICDFYENNPAINFEAVNIIFIELFEQLLTDMDNTMNSTINSQILYNVHENTNKINELNSSIEYLRDAVNTIQSDVTNSILIKFMELKKEYIEDMRLIIQDNTNEKIGSLLEKNNSLLIDKTNLLISDIIPKNQNQFYSQIQDSIRSFHKSISDDTRILLKYVDNNTIKEYINSFEMKSSMMMQNLQQPIYTFISASEDRINTNISNLKENSIFGNTLQTKLLGELTDFLQNYGKKENVTNKDSISIILNKIYSTSEIIPLNKSFYNSMFSRTPENNPQNNNNNFIIKRMNKQKVLIQNIDIDRNVNNDEIREFIQNMEDNNCHGVFLSQKSGFTSKPNFHIETHNKLIMVYVHNVEYSAEKITAAIDIIDNLYSKLRELNIENSYEISIEKDVLEEINKEYQAFIIHKESIMNVLKESQKKLFTQIEEFKFPALDKYLSTKFGAVPHKQGLKCDICKNFNAHNLKALAAHKRGCNRKNMVNHVVSITAK